MQVRELAHARAGDKGDISNVVVVAYDDERYELLAEYLTANVVAQELDDIVEGSVTRYDLGTLGAFNFVMEGALDGGGSKNLRLDYLGKSISYAVLGIDLDID